jgi:hypothetical protein
VGLPTIEVVLAIVIAPLVAAAVVLARALAIVAATAVGGQSGVGGVRLREETVGGANLSGWGMDRCAL